MTRTIALLAALAVLAFAATANAASARLDCGAWTPTIVGSDDPLVSDSIVGTPGPDVIQALAGDDTIYGGGGFDTAAALDCETTVAIP